MKTNTPAIIIAKPIMEFQKSIIIRNFILFFDFLRCWRGFAIRAIAASNTILLQLPSVIYFTFSMSYFGVISLKNTFLVLSTRARIANPRQRSGPDAIRASGGNV
nr:hypothetical protein [uncultured Draconibacterium sp.]